MAADLLFRWRRAVCSAQGPPSPTTRLVLLTLTVYMGQDGGSCFPSTRTLAEASALSERSVCTHLEIAVRDGWIERADRVMPGKRWRHYQYTPRIPPKVLKRFQHQEAEGAEIACAPRVEGAEAVSGGAEHHDRQVLKEVQSTASVNSSSNSSASPRCPHQEIVDLYNIICAPAGMPRVRKLNEAARRQLRSRWQEDESRQSSEWWRWFWSEKVAASDFLAGRAKDFVADMRWCIGPRNFTKILAGRYRNGGGSEKTHRLNRQNPRPRGAGPGEGKKYDHLATRISL